MEEASVLRKVGIIFLLLIMMVGLVACSSGENEGTNGEEKVEIIIAAAASLTDAFTEMGENFKTANPNSDLKFTFASSGQLQRQIEQEAPVDVYASAGQKQMNALEEKDLIHKDTRENFVENSIVMITQKENQDTIKEFSDLKNYSGGKIAIGDPEHVPVGQYTKSVFESLEVMDPLKEDIVLSNDVRQVLAYTETGEVELGFVFSSDSVASDKVRVIQEAPKDAYDTPLYPISIIKSSKQKEMGQKWIDYVKSGEGKEILQKWGFKPVE